jgi:hypothetical protein
MIFPEAKRTSINANKPKGVKPKIVDVNQKVVNW